MDRKTSINHIWNHHYAEFANNRHQLTREQWYDDIMSYFIETGSMQKSDINKYSYFAQASPNKNLSLYRNRAADTKEKYLDFMSLLSDQSLIGLYSYHLAKEIFK